MGRTANPSTALESIQQAGEGRALMAKAVMKVIDRTGGMLHQIGKDMGLRLREPQLGKGAVDPERHGVGGMLECRHK